ncbi:Trk family potassium uptake protein [candidate division KSB3 bacterium]|uniref:Trk family potassium uptake protein n=1 Tax=candidate division KSB3 bacterium TaxID=2044937 RepID=A0A2G6KAP0_9BACT|nr:MAG: Trk family potassium uptake protein [candidate division KSB3 bacterium]
MARWDTSIQEEKWLYALRWFMGMTALVGCILLVLDYGFYLPLKAHQWLEDGFLIIGSLFVVVYLLQLVIRQNRWKYLRANRIKYVVTGLILLEMLVVYLFQWQFEEMTIFQELSAITSRRPHTLILQWYILFNTLRWLVKVTQFLAQFHTSPARFILLSFTSVIGLGTGLLLLPKSSTIALSPIDALFTATSAVCVTGLIVVDTAVAFTKTGQLIILTLIQVGGLGIMTITAFFSLYIGKQMSGREQALLEDMLDTDRLAKLGSILKAIFFTTFFIELCGALLLYFSWRNDFQSAYECFYSSGFHSISAFCNAGFSTYSDSLMGYAGHMHLNTIMCSLIIIGGIGFGTLQNLWTYALSARQKTAPYLTVQTKLVLIMTVCLLVLGSILFFAFEFDHALLNDSWKEKLLGSFFQSATFRTAGFNTVDFSEFRDTTLLFAIVFMFIGAAPGSTGGGIKVTTIAILLSTVFAIGRGRTRVDLFRRTIPMMVFYQTLVVITMYLLIAFTVWSVLTVTEEQRPIELLFETVSALGTVGLTTGVTPQLSLIGRLLIICTMFLGRIGPFTLALAIGQRQQTERYRYPEERVQIG